MFCESPPWFFYNFFGVPKIQTIFMEILFLSLYTQRASFPKVFFFTEETYIPINIWNPETNDNKSTFSVFHHHHNRKQTSVNQLRKEKQFRLLLYSFVLLFQSLNISLLLQREKIIKNNFCRSNLTQLFNHDLKNYLNIRYKSD